jgi:hypothetical protein
MDKAKDPEREEYYYKMVFDDFSKDGFIEGLEVKTSLIELGVDNEQIDKRFALFVAKPGRNLASLERVNFVEWLELATVQIG